MITLFVDASIRTGRTGGAGVVVRVDPPMVAKRITIPMQLALPGTLSSNHAELFACLSAARILESLRSIIPGMGQAVVALKTDSAAAVKAVISPSAVRTMQTREIAKNVRRAFDDLRERRVILGWSIQKIGRSSNPADACAAAARKTYGDAFACPQENPPRT